LSQDEKARLAADGFVRTQQQFPTFTYGYATIYLEDLPIFVSADSILHAVHRSYDAILKGIELTADSGNDGPHRRNACATGRWRRRRVYAGTDYRPRPLSSRRRNSTG